MSAWEHERNVTCVVCPDCAFTFDADHTNTDGDYTCPVCRESALETAIRTAAAELRATHHPGPRGCITCYPQEGRWPCDAALVARDLTNTLEEGT